MDGFDQGDLPPVKIIGLDEVAQPMQSFFTTTQRAALVRLSEVLVPALNGHPGAIEAEVPAFLDFFVGKSLPDIQVLYREGLDGLDAEAKMKHTKPFADSSDAEVDAILKPRLASWMQDHYPTEKNKHFVAAAHHDILTATQNSPAWVTTSAKSLKPPLQATSIGTRSSRILFEPCSKPDSAHRLHQRSGTKRCAGKMAKDNIDVLIIGSGHSSGMAA